MKRLVIVFAAQLLLSVGVAVAQKPASVGQTGLGAAVSPGELKATPEMWFYEQAMRQYKDPKAQVRAREEFRTEQRIRRLESMRWYGFSNSRPRANGDPMNADYSPQWVSNPGYYPSRWNGVAQSAW
jgi:hypothetical protein